MPGTEPLDLQSIVDDIYRELTPRLGEGKVADYIPQLCLLYTSPSPRD